AGRARPRPTGARRDPRTRGVALHRRAQGSAREDARRIREARRRLAHGRVDDRARPHEQLLEMVSRLRRRVKSPRPDPVPPETGLKNRGVLARATLGSWLKKHFYLRIHMTLIVVATFCASIAATNLL